MTGRSPNFRTRRPIRAAKTPAVEIDFVEGPDGDRLLQDVSRALARQVARQLFSKHDDTAPVTTSAAVGRDG